MNENADVLSLNSLVAHTTTPKTRGEFTLLSVLEFTDDTLSVQPLGDGTLEQMRETCHVINAISYSGPKQVSKSYLRIVPTATWDEMKAKQKEAE